MNNEKQFYRKLQNNAGSTNNKPPTWRQIEELWKSIWAVPTAYKTEAPWIDNEEERIEHLRPMSDTGASLEQIERAIGCSVNWRVAGIDCLQNF